MKKLYLKEILKYLIPILMLMVISFLNMYNARFILDLYNNYLLKQVIYYLIGFIIVFICIKVDYKFIYKNIFVLYIFMNCLLLYVLFFLCNKNSTICYIGLILALYLFNLVSL